MINNKSLISDNLIHSALKYYPDLQHININIVSGSIRTTMQARPLVSNILKTKDKKEYVIVANIQKQDKNGILIHEAPEDAALGILTHELGHIQDYLNKSNIELLVLGVKYLFPKFRRKYEKQIDLLTIKHGAGHHLLAYTKHILESPNASKEYKRKLRKYYLGPEEIRILIEES